MVKGGEGGDERAWEFLRPLRNNPCADPSRASSPPRQFHQPQIIISTQRKLPMPEGLLRGCSYSLFGLLAYSPVQSIDLSRLLPYSSYQFTHLFQTIESQASTSNTITQFFTTIILN